MKKQPPTDVVTLRLQETEIEAIDAIVEYSNFRSRNECVRHLLQPSLLQFVEAINTKSAFKAGIRKISAEMDLNKRLTLARKNSMDEDQLPLPNMDEISLDVQPA
jgi:metal-responsive CopG/Arc/MetJ family transcriptional regulator